MNKPTAPPIPVKWSALLRRIPGYDPITTAAGCTFDIKAAQRALDFFPECQTHIEGALSGTPFILQPWQQSIVANLFGWKRPDGSRRYREALIYVPRKNGKTPLCAAIANYVLFCDDELGQQNVCAAGEREQAALLFRHVKGMIENEPRLSKRCTIFKATGMRSIEAQRGFFKVISSEGDTKHGGNLHLAIIDELHVQPNRNLVDALLTGMASKNRRQPLALHITTADYDRESICNEKHDYACKVRDGVIADPYFLPVIYEAARDADWTSEKTWEKANPNIDISVSREYLQRECKRAQDTPAYENTFKRFHLNIITEQANRWLALDRWDACGDPFDAKELLGKECYAGLDLSSKSDITALVLVFPWDNDYRVLPFFWIPSENASERERKDRVPYMTWARAGFIETTPGNVIDYRYIRSRLNELKAQYNLREIAYDPWNSEQLALQLQDEDGMTMVSFRQGFVSMNEPCKEIEALVLRKGLRHNANPVLRWMASNVAARTDPAGNIKIDKERSSEKVDGMVALAMGLGRAMVRDRTGGASVYDSRGVDFL